MPTKPYSLLAGRNRAPLSSEEIRRALNTFVGLDESVNARHEPGRRTGFEIVGEGTAEEYGEVVFGADIYPGSSVLDPNSALSLDAAAAHELTHYYRWKDKTALANPALRDVDEALTSLQSVMRYDKHLSESDVRQLVCDAMQRLQLYVRDLLGRAGGTEKE